MRRLSSLSLVCALLSGLSSCSRSPTGDSEVTAAIQRAETLLGEGQSREALDLIEPLLKSHGDLLELRITAARAEHLEGHSDLALQQLLEAKKLDDSDPRAVLMLGRLYSQYGQWRQAVESFETALERGAARAEVRIGLGIALGKMRDFDRAVALFTEEIETKGDVSSAYYNRGVAREATSELAAALDDYRAALRADDANVSALQGLARFLLDCTQASLRDPTEALALADKAAALAPQSPECLLIQARAQEANGDPAAGARTIEKALELGPDDMRRFTEHLVRMREEAGESAPAESGGSAG